MTGRDLHSLLAATSNRHRLKRGGSAYLEGFIRAFIAVHSPPRRAVILQKKFFVPDELGYTDDAFYASASELTVANHVLQQPQIQDFCVDKRLNAKNRKDVDVWFGISATEVAVEVNVRSNFRSHRFSGEAVTAGHK